MAITGIDTIEGKQIIAAGAISAKSAEIAYNDENGNPITGYLTAIPESELSAYIPFSASGVELPNSNFKITPDGQAYKIGSSNTVTGTKNGIATEFVNNTLKSNTKYYPEGYTGTLTKVRAQYWDVNKGSWGDWEYYNITVESDGFTITDAIPSDTDTCNITIWIDNSVIDSPFSLVEVNGGAEIPYALATDIPVVTGYVTTADLTAYQPVGDYLTTADSANFYTTANESGFVTSGELPTIGFQEGETLDTDYDGLKIVKSTANGNEHINLHKKSTDQWLIHGNLVPTSPGSNKYLVTDDSGAMHWDNKSALAYDSAFEQSGGYITAYNGSAFKAGDELPSGVMVESGLEYNSQGYISGYAGSAITGEATIYTDSATMSGQGTVSEPFGVKSTDLFVQGPLYTGVSGNSAYIGWNNETVLWSGTPVASVSGNYITLSENITGFETIKVTMGNDTWATVSEFPSYVNRFECQRIARDSQNYSIIDLAGLYKDASNPLKWVSQGGVRITFTGNAIQNTNLSGMFVRSVIGINRKV